MVAASRDGPETGGDTVLRVFAGVSFFFALIQISCFILGLAGVRLDQPLAIGVLLAAVVLASLGARCGKMGGAPPTGTDAASIGDARPPSLGEKIIVIGLVLWAGFSWIRLWVLSYRRPPYDWDGLYYHIPAMHSWAMAGGVRWVNDIPDIPFVNYPMGVEAFTLFAHFVLGTDRFINACNLWYWPLAFLASVVIAGRLGAGPLWRWVAGALVAGVPVVIGQSVSCYVDTGFAAAVMGSVAASYILVFHRSCPRWWKTLLWAANIGLMVGSKGTGLLFAVLLFLAAPIWALAEQGWDRWATWLKHVLLATLVVLMVGGHWYVRNAVITGNPIYPLELKFGEKTLAEGWDPVAFTEANLPPWLAEYPPKARMFISWLELDAPIHGYAPVGGLGYIWLAGGIPALLYLWATMFNRERASRRRRRELGFLTLLIILLLALQPSAWWSRLTIWLHALGLPCVAAVMAWAASRWRARKAHLITLVVGMAVIGYAVREAETTMALEKQTGWYAEEDGARGEYLSSQEYMFPGFDEAPAFDEFCAAPRIARSYWGYMGTLMGGVLALPLDKREIHVLPSAPSRADLVQLRAAGIVWVIWDIYGAGEVPPILIDEAEEIYVYEEGPQVNFRIIRLKPRTTVPDP